MTVPPESRWRPRAASSVAHVLTSTRARCVLASQPPARPGDEHRSARPSQTYTAPRGAPGRDRRLRQRIARRRVIPRLPARRSPGRGRGRGDDDRVRGVGIARALRADGGDRGADGDRSPRPLLGARFARRRRNHEESPEGPLRRRHHARGVSPGARRPPGAGQQRGARPRARGRARLGVRCRARRHARRASGPGAFTARVRDALGGRDPLAFLYGPDEIRRVAIVSGGAAGLLPAAAAAATTPFSPASRQSRR